ncbi:MAG: LacI family DNA-binding transcriptional regulator [Candidatus Eiseniibacteriota bacterium]
MTTIKDVAREARVSVATVSRVFNDSTVVSEGTRQTVREVAERLNYWPNGAARSLITNRTQAIGVMLPDLFGEFYSEVLRGMDATARRAGYHLLVFSSHADPTELLAGLRMIRGRVDGLIAMAPDLDAQSAIRATADVLPLVLMAPAAGFDGHETVSIANHQGARLVVRHLARLGHRRIATITGPAHNADARQRLEGYRAALREAGIAAARELEIPGDFSEPSGYEAVGRLLQIHPRPTAVFAANDYMAIGVLGALSDAGVRVPQDIALAGFDDIAMARYLNPALTTVHVDACRLGEQAVERLLQHLGPRPPRAPHHEVLETTLVVRRSCGSSSARQPRGGTLRKRGR